MNPKLTILDMFHRWKKVFLESAGRKVQSNVIARLRLQKQAELHVNCSKYIDMSFRTLNTEHKSLWERSFLSEVLKIPSVD